MCGNVDLKQLEASARAKLTLCESKNGEERIIDRPQLFGCEVSHSLAESLGVDSSELFDEDARRVAVDGYLRSKRGGSGAA